MDASAANEFLRDYEALRSALKQVGREFEHAARAFPDFYFESVSAPQEPLSQESWAAFIEANKLDDESETWEIDPDGVFCMRYYGNQEWFEHFRRLAESGFLVLREIEWNLRTLPTIPSGCKLDLPDYDGHSAWVHLLGVCAQISTPFLRHVGRVWNEPDGYEGDTDELIYKSWEKSTNGEERFPKHPFCVALQHNLFRSSAEAIRIWLEPNRITTVGEDWYGGDLIKLPSLDEDVLRVAMAAGGSHEAKTNVKPRFELPTPEGVAPVRYGKLFLGDRLLKEFNQEAGAKVPILKRFQEEGWNHRVISPLHKKDMSDSERRKANDDVRKALYTLNKSVRKFMRFRSARGFIEWQLCGRG